MKNYFEGRKKSLMLERKNENHVFFLSNYLRTQMSHRNCHFQSKHIIKIKK